MPADSEKSEDGLSRRQVLARGAVAAGVIWAAPVIRSASAYATSSSGTERPCINFYLVCIDVIGVRPVRFAPDVVVYDDISPEAAALIATTTTSSTSTTTTTAPPTSETTAPAGPGPTAPTTTSTTTTTTTTTTPPATTDPATETPAGEPDGTDSTPPSTAGSVVPTPGGVEAPDDFGLFPDPTGGVTPAVEGAAAPVDGHAVLLAAALAANQAGTPDNLPPGISDWLADNPDVPVRYPTSLPMLTQAGDEGWAVTLAAVDGPDPLTHQCRVVKGWAQSKGKFEEFFLDPDPELLDEFGRRAVFPNPRTDELVTDPTALIENVIFVFCCPQ